MDNRNVNQPDPQNDQWLDDKLGEAFPTQEISLDESAVSAAGLRHPDKLNIENILAENWDEEPVQEELMQEELVQTEAASEELPLDILDKEIPVEEVEIAAEAQQTAEPEIPAKRRKKKPTPQKRRPTMKKGYGLLGIPHILATVIWLFLIVAIGVSLGRTIWVCCADVMAFGKEPQEVTITITHSDNIDTISEKLGTANLIRYPGLFKLFAELTEKDDNISVGTFKLNSQFDYNAMINAMGSRAPSREEVEILFPEGYNCAQIFKLLEDNKVCTVEELEAYAAEGELDDYWFLEDVPRGDKYCLEGYLAPDTYKFYTNDEPERVLEKFLDEFDDRFTDKMHEDLATMQQRYADMLASHGYGEDYIEENKLTLHKAITLASIVEKETSSNAECYKIASVFYNRLTNPGEFPFLDSDATVYYAIGDYFGDTKDLTAEQLDTDSPYNTRKAQGLPPGPICNPGVYAVYSALDPDETNYHYFVYDKNAYKHRFSETYNGHLALLNELGL